MEFLPAHFLYILYGHFPDGSGVLFYFLVTKTFNITFTLVAVDVDTAIPITRISLSDSI